MSSEEGRGGRDQDRDDRYQDRVVFGGEKAISNKNSSALQRLVSVLTELMSIMGLNIAQQRSENYQRVDPDSPLMNERQRERRQLPQEESLTDMIPQSLLIVLNILVYFAIASLLYHQSHNNQETPRTNNGLHSQLNNIHSTQVKDTPIFAAGLTSLNESINKGGSQFNDQNNIKSFHNSQTEFQQNINFNSQNTFNQSYSMEEQYSQVIKRGLDQSNQNFQCSEIIGQNLTAQPRRQSDQNTNRRVSSGQEGELEDFMKSTNSALSDYNFLFENIDQQLQNNTQMMAEELQKNLPDYLMNTNSMMKEELKQVADSSELDYDQFDKNLNMPKMILREPLMASLGSAANNTSQLDLADMSDEIISIEDTYRETNAVCRKSQEQQQQPLPENIHKSNKSMTIIEEEDFEESTIVNMTSNLGLQASQRVLSLKKQGSQSRVSGPSCQHRNLADPLRDSFETFGGMGQPSGHQSSKALDSSLQDLSKSKVHQYSTQYSSQANLLGQGKDFESKNQIFDYNQGSTAAHTLEGGGKSIKSPMIQSNVSTISAAVTYNDNPQKTHKRNFSNNEATRAYAEEEQENPPSVQDMLKKYQEKYKKQKKESMKFQVIEMKRVDQSDFSHNDDSEEYINRSFVSTSKTATKLKRAETASTNIYGDKEIGTVSASRPFDFIETSTHDEFQSNNHHYRTQVERETQALQRELSNLQEQFKIQENQKLKLEKSLLQQQINFDIEQQKLANQLMKEIRIKEKECENLNTKLEMQASHWEDKMEGVRERMKRVEKTVYERVEQEYAQILQQKNLQIEDLEHEIKGLGQEIVHLKDQKHRDIISREMEHGQQQLRERQRLVEDREQVKIQQLYEADKEVKKLKERLEQEYEFKMNQMEHKYKQQYKILELQYRSQQDQFVREKEFEFGELRTKEQQRFQEEKLVNHAKATHDIYEDVTKVLFTKNKEETRDKLARVRQDVVNEYEDKLRKAENKLNCQLALERKEKGKVELHNAKLEQQLYELQEKLRTLESNKENFSTQQLMTKGSNYSSTDLKDKLKKVNRAMSIK